MGTMNADDESRFEALYHEHFRVVLRYALARLEPERARDVTAETFLIAWRRLPDVPQEARPWLLGVAHKVVAGQLRTDARLDQLQQRLWETASFNGGRLDPGDEVADREAVYIALSRLSDTDREILRLVAWDQLPHSAAAEVMGLSRFTFAVRLHRAWRRLANELDRVAPVALRPVDQAVLPEQGAPDALVPKGQVPVDDRPH